MADNVMEQGGKQASTYSELEEHAVISGVGGKKVFVVDPSGNQFDPTDGSQKTQIVDAGGEAATVTDGKLDVNATASLAGEEIPVSGATEAVAVAIVDTSGDQIASFGGGVQYEEGDIDETITGTAAMWEDADNTLRVPSASKPLPVDVKASALPTGAATAVNQQTDALTDTELRATPVPISGTVTADLGANNDVTMAVLPDTAAGDLAAIESNTDGIETVLGTIDADTSSLAGAVAGTELQVDVVGSLPAGTNAIGKLAANSGVDIGDVDVTSIPAVSLAAAQTLANVTTLETITNVVHVDDNGGAITVDGTLTASPAPNTTIYNGQKAVTTGGTQVALAASQAVKWVIVKALADNTGNIYVGDSSVDSTNGYVLTPGEAIGLDVANLATVYIDSDEDGEGVSYIGMN